MRVFAALMMACLAVGAYGASLELEHLRRVLNDLLAKKQDRPPPPCVDPEGGIRVELPRGPDGPPADFVQKLITGLEVEHDVVIDAELEQKIQDALDALAALKDNLPPKDVLKDVLHVAFEACKPADSGEEEDPAEKELIAELRELLGRSAEDKPLLAGCVHDELLAQGYDVPTGPLRDTGAAGVYMLLRKHHDDNDKPKPPGFALHLAIDQIGDLADCPSPSDD